MRLDSQSRPSTHVVTRELADELLHSSGKLILRAAGRSMVPTIWPGDTLVVEPIGESSLQRGDIVLFSTKKRFVAHRVIAKAKNRGPVTTCGDASLKPDAPVRQGDLLGKVAFVIRNGKCMQPARTLSGSQRAFASLLRRSETAARVIVGIHGFGRTSKPTI